MLTAQSLIGAWERFETDADGRQLHNVVIFADGYQASSWFDAATGAFISTNGGAWSVDKKTITEVVEFDTEQPARVGTQITFRFKIKKGQLIAQKSKKTWTRIDAGAPGALAGAWLFAGRMRDGEIQRRAGDRPRKTMKILSGTRFQWIAYNTETGAFFGTGGGTYTTIDGKYTEAIGFFSRDDSRVGAELQFDYELQAGEWHHSGLNSRGEPLYEIWGRRE